MSQPQQPLDPRLERALAHPTRRSILELLMDVKGLAPSSISEKLGIPAANAIYHVDVLTTCGAVEVVADEARRGERLVRLCGRSPESGMAPRASDSMRDDVSAEQLKSLIEMAAHLRPRHAPGA